MGKIIDLTGQQFGELTVIQRDINHKSTSKNDRQAYWICQCSCGNITSVASNNLRRGNTKSCGCKRTLQCFINHENNKIDITNKKFGYLTAISPIYEKNKKTKWICKCDCGNICVKSLDTLQKGEVKSCGCHRYDNQHSQLDDLTGQQFGYLTVLYRGPNTNSNNIRWHCRCVCGKEIDVIKHNLIDGRTQSCGCKSISKGEQKISHLLLTNNITFETQKTFPDCIFINSNYPAKFDFFVNNTYLIEFDGQQHYQAVEAWGGEPYLEQTKQHDQYKNNWCKEHNIPLIRIPYTKLDNLCLEDLLLETTKYEVNKNDK